MQPSLVTKSPSNRDPFYLIWKERQSPLGYKVWLGWLRNPGWPNPDPPVACVEQPSKDLFMIYTIRAPHTCYTHSENMEDAKEGATQAVKVDLAQVRLRVGEWRDNWELWGWKKGREVSK